MENETLLEHKWLLLEQVFIFDCAAKKHRTHFLVCVYSFTYFLYNESRSFSFLLGHLLHFHSLCELFAKCQMSLQRWRKSDTWKELNIDRSIDQKDKEIGRASYQ